MKISKDKLIFWYLIGIFCVSLAFRVALAIIMDQLGLEYGVWRHAPDASSFEVKGWQIAQGAPTGSNWWSPGYILFVAFIYKIFGHHGLPVMLIQAFMGSCVTILIFDLTRFLFGLPAAVIASVLTAFSRIMIRYSVHYFSESLAIFFLVLFLWLMIKSLDNNWYFMAGGLSLGWASFFRMPVILFSFVVLIWMFIFFRKKISATILLWFAFILLVYLPTSIITYRNYAIDNSPAFGRDTRQAAYLWRSYDEYGLKLDSLGFNPFVSVKKSFQIFVEKPYEIASLWTKKAAVNFKEFYLDDNLGVINFFFISPHKFKNYEWIFQISWLFPILGGYLGIKTYWIKQRFKINPEAAIFSLAVFLLAYYTFIHSVLFFGFNRFRMPVHFVVLMLAGAGFWYVWEKIKHIVTITTAKRF